VIPGQMILKKKRAAFAVGWILLIFGLIGLIVALTIYPIWQRNGRILAENEFYGVDTPEEHDLYDTQMVLVLGGLLVGAPMLIGGAYLVASASSYNRKIEGALIQKAMQPYPMYQGTPGAKSFCSYCGNQVFPGAEVCTRCGRRLT